MKDVYIVNSHAICKIFFSVSGGKSSDYCSADHGTIKLGHLDVG